MKPEILRDPTVRAVEWRDLTPSYRGGDPEGTVSPFALAGGFFVAGQCAAVSAGFAGVIHCFSGWPAAGP